MSLIPGIKQRRQYMLNKLKKTTSNYKGLCTAQLNTIHGAFLQIVNGKKAKSINYFSKKASSQMYDRVLITPLHCIFKLRNKLQKQPPAVFSKKGVLNYFGNFTGKHLCFPVKFPKCLRAPILKNICERLLLKLTLFGTAFTLKSHKPLVLKSTLLEKMLLKYFAANFWIQS